jgi:hypothetical protein
MDNQGSLLDFKLIKNHTNKIIEEAGYSASIAFIALVLQSRLGLDEYEVEDAIIDGSNDCGIDAIFIDESDDERAKVYLVQSKYYQSDDKYYRSFEAGALGKIQQAIADLILHKPKSESYMNQKLQDRINDINMLPNPSFHIIFMSNSYPPTEKAKDKFEEFLEKVNHGQDFFTVEYLHLADISTLLAPQKNRVINAKLKLTGSYMTADTGVARTVIGRISGIELAKLRQENNLELFDRNVRGYLSRSNEVNKKIIQTATGDDAYRFFFLNNGLTLVCSKYKYLPADESPEIEVSDLQIVNGGQTTNALYEAYAKSLLKDQVSVLIRIIETTDDELLEKITESTNTQTLVNARDLRSNDTIQKKIESHLRPMGYYYEARTNRFKDDKAITKDKRVDAVKAAQAYYAYSEQKPADAKNKPRLLFGTLYSEIFNDSLDIDTFLNSYLIYKHVNSFTKKIKTKYSFASYAEFHTLAVLKKLGIIDLKNINRVNNLIERVLDATAEVVQNEINVKKESYSHRAFFVETTTLGRIEEITQFKHDPIN